MKPTPRAFRHLGLTVGTWIGGRIMFSALSGLPIVPGAGHAFDQNLLALASLSTTHLTIARRAFPDTDLKIGTLSSVAPIDGWVPANPPPAISLAQANDRLVQSSPSVESASSIASQPRPSAIAPDQRPVAPSIDRWSLSAWAIYRPDQGPVGLSPNGQLGGSQFGFRIQRRLFQPSPNLTVSLNLRASTPLEASRGKEAGLGLAIRRAGRVPVELIAERRVGLDRGGRDAFAALIATGVNDLPVLAGFSLNGYAQAGIVGFRRRDGFADGSVRLERDVAATGSLKVQLGGGVWGAIQPGVSRIDIGPSAAVRFRIGSAGVRLGGEWRTRVSGDARPGSGPAITFGLDY